MMSMRTPLDDHLKQELIRLLKLTNGSIVIGYIALVIWAIIRLFS